MLILIGLGALWAAVLVPPIVRNKISSNSSAPAIANHLDVYQVPSMKGQGISLPQSVSAARRRRRDVAIALVGIAIFTFLASIAVGGIFIWTVHIVIDLALLGYVTLIAQRREIATEETPLVLTHSFISNSLDEDYSYPEAV
tara:strand:+ start:842 stop:1267 length:426 start_codon:yes stop_codon:yes gene_type:complete